MIFRNRRLDSAAGKFVPILLRYSALHPVIHGFNNLTLG